MNCPFSERMYIEYRRLKAALSYMVYAVIAIACPIKPNKIVFSAFEGNGYGCNPKYIAEEIIRRDKARGTSHELIWLVNDTSKEFPYPIRGVKNNIWNRAYHLSTAKIWVDNARKNYGTRKRNGQFYIQTWHGPIGVKPEGKRRGKSFSRIARIVTKYDAKMDDYFLINSRIAEVDFSKAFYGEPLIKTGSPRCDGLINQRERQYKWVRKKLGISETARILMYAPTFRSGSQSKKRVVTDNVVTLDFKRLLDAFHDRFGGEWYLLLRLHPQLALRNKTFKQIRGYSDRCIDISKMDDMYEYIR